MLTWSLDEIHYDADYLAHEITNEKESVGWIKTNSFIEKIPSVLP